MDTTHTVRNAALRSESGFYCKSLYAESQIKLQYFVKITEKIIGAEAGHGA